MTPPPPSESPISQKQSPQPPVAIQLSRPEKQTAEDKNLRFQLKNGAFDGPSVRELISRIFFIETEKTLHLDDKILAGDN